MRLLYLGTDPSRYPKRGNLTHFPIIETVPADELPSEIQAQWPLYSHILFTSPAAVRHWLFLSDLPLEEKELLAIGPATASLLLKKAIQPPFATQEGIAELIKMLPIKHLFWPRSSRSRPYLSRFLLSKNIPFTSFELYKTVAKNKMPLPDLSSFDEIIFTSPSTVDAFFKLFKNPLSHQILTPIGPVTKAALKKFFPKRV